MKRILQYIFLILIGLVTSCQQPELIEPEREQEVEVDSSTPVSGKVPIMMSAYMPYREPTTKAMGKDPDIDSLHLVVFDENGMFVEVAKAEFTSEPVLPDDNSELAEVSKYIRNFKVVLTLADEPRIIHFIANCPVDQIVYGHEASIIGNLHVKDGETAYWSRAEVPHIKVEGGAEDNGYGSHYHPCPDIKNHLEKVHLLRNFAQIMVIDNTNNPGDKFEMLGYSVYNTIDIGTVAPYNNQNEEHPFQCFVDWHEKVEEGEDGEDEVTHIGTGTTYTYEQLLAKNYEGHALSAATLNMELPTDEAGNIIWWPLPEDPANPNENLTVPFFMYERKVSVKTDEEEKWRESPPHVIVWAKYDGKECYYKFDLVYTTSDKEVKYYNILRNFLYHFTITNVTSPGYETVEEAIAGAPSNNLAGSTSTSKFPEISVGDASLSVSYTDTTLVKAGTISFKYRYEKNGEFLNSSPYVTLVNSEGTVISDCNISTTDINDRNSKWNGYREVTLTINAPTNKVEEQIMAIRTEDQNLSRNIRFILRKKIDIRVECEPRIFSGVDVEQYVNIMLPPGLTEDMFPLDLAIEVKGLTLTPDVGVDNNHLPVNTGPSIIPDNTQNSFYFTKTIATYKEYMDELDKDSSNYRIVRTSWRTNRVANASTVWVANKYFNPASAQWTNVNYEFSNVQVNTTNIPKGLDRDVQIQFKMDDKDNVNNNNAWRSRSVTVNLVGLRNPNPTGAETESKMIITPNVTRTNVTVDNNTKTVTISGLKTSESEERVGFDLVCDDYKLDSDLSDARLDNAFTNCSFSKDKLDAEANIPVTYTFTLPQHYVDIVDGKTQDMTITVKMDGLLPTADENKLDFVSTESSIRTYHFTPSEAGEYTFQLKTTNNEASICWISLDAEKYYYAPVRSEINQAMKEFSNLNIAAVRQGTGRSVNVTFNVADADKNVNKDINVSLVGMKRSTDDATSFTVNTGSNDVTSNNGKITLSNIVTTSVADPLTVTISAKDYTSSSFTLDNRQSWQFTTFTLNPTSVGAAAGQEVTLTFNSDGLYEGLPVTIELDGLVPATSSQSTKAVNQYVHTVSGTGDQEVKLVTAETVTANTTCSVKLMAEGFETAEKTVSQNTANHVLKASNTNCTSSAVYDVQAVYQMDKLTHGQDNYKLVFYARADQQINAGNFSIYFKINGNSTQQQLNNQGPVTTTWKKWEIDLDGQNNDRINNAYDMLCFNLGRVYNGNAIYIDNVSLVNEHTGKEYVLNGEFEGDVVLSSEENKYDGIDKAAPVGTWWVKQNDGASQKPNCTLEIVEYVRND